MQRPILLKVRTPVWDDSGITQRNTVYSQQTNWVIDFPLKAIGANGRIRYDRDVGHDSPVTLHYDFQYNPSQKYYEGTLLERRIK